MNEETKGGTKTWEHWKSPKDLNFPTWKSQTFLRTG